MAQTKEILMKWDSKLGAYTQAGKVVDRDTSADAVQLMKPRIGRSSFKVVNLLAMWSISASLLITTGSELIDLVGVGKMTNWDWKFDLNSSESDSADGPQVKHKGCICETFDVPPNGSTLRITDDLRDEEGRYVVFSETIDTCSVYLASSRRTERMAKRMYPDFKDIDIEENGLPVTPDNGRTVRVSICKRQTNTH